jgi:DNA-binding NarL/FixJ family response regulator
MAMAALDMRGLEPFTPTATSVSTTALAPPSEVVTSRGWSCSDDWRVERPLSPREQQILTLIIDGKTRKEVAYDLEIAHSTVRVIYSRAMKKLGGHWQPIGRKL